jgi:hypothetical protein
MPKKPARKTAALRKEVNTVTPKQPDLTADAIAQDDCLFLSLPLEVRHMIYKLSFEEERIPGSDFVRGITDDDYADREKSATLEDETSHRHSPYRSLPNWSRPGCTGRTKTHTDILRTCKTVYAEAAPLLVSSKVHVGYQAYGPQNSSPSEYLERLTEEQLQNVRRFHLYTNVGDFDDHGRWLRKELEPIASNLQHLTITLRHLGRAPDRPLLLNPYRSSQATRKNVDADMKAQGTRDLRVAKLGWAGTFTQLPALQTLTMELEDEENRAEELKSMVDWAQTWALPFGENSLMTVKAVPTRRTWRRPLMHRCSQRHQYDRDESPRIITWSICWDEQTEWEESSPVMVETTKTSRTRRESLRSAKPTFTRFERPAYDACLGGLNTIFASASDEQIQSLVDYGIL